MPYPPPLPRIAASLSELAEMTGVSERTLRRWAREEEMPTYRVGGRVLVHLGDFEGWLRGHRERSQEDVDQVVDGVVASVVDSMEEGS